MLITIDEAQAVPLEDLSAIARGLQTVVARRLQPVAVIFGGLPTFREALAGAGTYASRLPVDELGDLEPSPARLALVEPAARRHVAWEPEALDLLVRRSGGHPYYVQLFGWHAWEAAPKGSPPSPWRTPRLGWPQPEPNLGAIRRRLGTSAAPNATTWWLWPPWAARAAPGSRKWPRRWAKSQGSWRWPATGSCTSTGCWRFPERAKVGFVDAEMADWVARRPDSTSTTAIVHKGPAPSGGQGRGRPSTSPFRDAQPSGRRRPSANRPKDLGR